MSDYRHGSHTTFSIHLHIVWITKYRHKVLRGEVAERVRAIVREECQQARVDIRKGHISSDHVHVMVAIPPHVTISRLIQRMKGKSSYRLLAEFPHLRKRFWGRHVWARGYFCRRSGNVTDEVGRGASPATLARLSGSDSGFSRHHDLSRYPKPPPLGGGVFTARKTWSDPAGAPATLAWAKCRPSRTSGVR
jgi:putative transposase